MSEGDKEGRRDWTSKNDVLRVGPGRHREEQWPQALRGVWSALQRVVWPALPVTCVPHPVQVEIAKRTCSVVALNQADTSVHRQPPPLLFHHTARRGPFLATFLPLRFDVRQPRHTLAVTRLFATLRN